MNIEEIKERFHRHEKSYAGDSGEAIDYLLHYIERSDNLMKIMDSTAEVMVKAMGKTESGTRLILIETMLQKYLYYKEHPSELKSFLKSIQGEG